MKTTLYDTLTDKKIMIRFLISTLFVYFAHSRFIIDPYSPLGRPPVSDSVRFAIFLASFLFIINVVEKTIKKNKVKS
ncbi:MAG: hypothetical protein JJT76_14700 [Clostridiaceae bacterium]|nr:hypothetical protein [Clostridiaceae bacterium]